MSTGEGRSPPPCSAPEPAWPAGVAQASSTWATGRRRQRPALPDLAGPAQVGGRALIAVIGATGTAGSRTAVRLKDRGVDLVEISRSRGVDLIGGQGVFEALEGVDELTARLLHRLGDPRPVRTAAPALPALADGALLAPEHATILGPTTDAWLHAINAAGVALA